MLLELAGDSLAILVILAAVGFVLYFGGGGRPRR